jgi:hypothetical protein
MRDMDQIECLALGRTPKEALRGGLRASVTATTVMVDGRPVAIMGVVPLSLINGRGWVWMLGTDEVYGHARDFARYAPLMIEQWLTMFERLENIVAVPNRQAIRLLQYLGFTVEDRIEVHEGIGFRPFFIERRAIQEERQAA